MWGEVKAFLEHFELIHPYKAPINLPICALMHNIIQDLETCDQGFTFTPTPQSWYLWACENLNLDLLDMVNQGVQQLSTCQVYLHPAFTTPQMDLKTIANNTHFVNPNLTIVNGHIILYFSK